MIESMIIALRHTDGQLRIVFPSSKSFRDLTPAEVAELGAGELILIARHLGGAGVDPRTFGFRWFVASLWLSCPETILVLSAQALQSARDPQHVS